MRNESRWEEIVKQVNEHGYLSVEELSQRCDASIVTIRRDLVYLNKVNRLRRTHGGAASLQAVPGPVSAPLPTPALDVQVKQQVMDRVDALITSDPLAGMLPVGAWKHKIPIVADSLAMPEAETCVEVDNYAAGFELGCWAGQYALHQWNGQAKVLDLTYHRPNTQDRSRGFLNGIRSVLPGAELCFSINTQSRREMAYQLTRDALSIHPDINIIFAINDISALGAHQACKDLGLPADHLIILPFGVEGPSVLNLIEKGEFIAAGLCMFPEIVAAVCLEAAIAAYNGHILPLRLTTPFCIVSQANLDQVYRKSAQGWNLRWPGVSDDLDLPLPVDIYRPNPQRRLPGRVGFLYTFVEHEWYQSIVRTMSEYAQRLGIQLELMDFGTTQKDELQLRRVEIARRAAGEVMPGDTIFIDGGPIAAALAEQLAHRADLTVITNSLAVLEKLSGSHEITLISTGGALRRSSHSFVGPTAEATLKEFHIDKLFLMVSGVSHAFGLSHTDFSEVTIKQQMIRSTREVILLADYACFQEEALVQVAPLSVVHKLITDDTLPASIRLELATKGIHVILATM